MLTRDLLIEEKKKNFSLQDGCAATIRAGASGHTRASRGLQSQA